MITVLEVLGSEVQGFRGSGSTSISAKLYLRRGTVEGLMKKNEHRTSNVQHRILNGKR
jgi:hypothetical protein